MNRYYAVLLILFMLSSVCKSQVTDTLNEGLVIDPGIEQQAKSLFRKGIADMTAKFDVTIYENNKKKNDMLISGKAMPHWSIGSYQGDSLMFLFTHFLGPVYGLKIVLTKDSCYVQYLKFTRDGEGTFRIKQDAAYERGIAVSGKFYLALNKRAPAAKDDPIYGYLEFTSNDYYERSDSADLKLRVDFRGYFMITSFQDIK